MRMAGPETDPVGKGRPRRMGMDQVEPMEPMEPITDGHQTLKGGDNPGGSIARTRLPLQRISLSQDSFPFGIVSIIIFYYYYH